MLSDHPPGTIAVPCGDIGRYHAFTQSLGSVCKPEGSSLAMAQGISIPENLNEMIEGMLSREDQWIWLLADDMAFAANTLLLLLECDVDIVVPLIARRRPPFQTVLYKRDGDEIAPLSFNQEIPKTGLFEVESSGSGAMLIRREVLESLGGPPWFTYGSEVEAMEDVDFCARVVEEGYKIHVCADVRVGHCTPAIVWPVDVDRGEWGIGLQLGPRAEDFIFAKPGS